MLNESKLEIFKYANTSVLTTDIRIFIKKFLRIFADFKDHHGFLKSSVEMLIKSPLEVIICMYNYSN